MSVKEVEVEIQVELEYELSTPRQKVESGRWNCVCGQSSGHTKADRRR